MQPTATCSATCYNTLQPTATCTDTLQHTATHCNTLQLQLPATMLVGRFLGHILFWEPGKHVWMLWEYFLSCLLLIFLILQEVFYCGNCGSALIDVSGSFYLQSPRTSSQDTSPATAGLVGWQHRRWVRLTATHCNALQRTAKYTATHCKAPQHTATYRNMLQQILLTDSMNDGYASLQHITTQCNARCNILQCTAAYTAEHCNTLQQVWRSTARKIGAPHCNTLHCTATHVAICYNTLQHTAPHWNTLQHNATQCNALQQMQHTATHCNTPQHTASHFNTM